MSSSFSKSTFIGNLTDDPDVTIRRKPGADKDTVIAKFSLAVADFKRRKPNSEEYATDFFDFVVFGRQADFMKQYAAKGLPMHVECKPRQERWKDEATGQNRQRIVFYVSELQLLRFKEGEKSAPPAPPPSNEGDDDSVPF